MPAACTATCFASTPAGSVRKGWRLLLLSWVRLFQSLLVEALSSCWFCAVPRLRHWIDRSCKRSRQRLPRGRQRLAPSIPTSVTCIPLLLSIFRCPFPPAPHWAAQPPRASVSAGFLLARQILSTFNNSKAQ